MRKPKRILHLAYIGIAAVIMCFTACGNRQKTFVFNSGKEALEACNKQLSELRGMTECDTEELTEIITTWSVLRDSVICYFMRDSLSESDMEIQSEFLDIPDSIRREITRLAFSRQRTMKEVVTIRKKTAKNTSNVKKEDYKVARKFFGSMDDAPLFPTLEQTLVEYDKILTGNPFKKEGELHEFIRKEDRCFRSLLAHLNDVPQKQLQVITNKTAALFNNLYTNATADLTNEVNERVMLYLTMRFNRRVIQNAEVCKKNINQGVLLTDQMAGNYRWMIIQPYMTIDNYGMALLTDKQGEILGKLADELPRLLAYVDGKDYDKTPKEERRRLSKILSDYFLNAFIKTL